MSERSPLGEVIDRAARLLDAGDGAGLRLDTVSAGLVGDRFELTDTGSNILLVDAHTPATTTRRLLGKPVECRGRERELVTLQAIFDDCCEEPMGSVALITGAPGVGKSLLRDEFIRRVTSERGDVQVWMARGDPLSARSPFGLLAQALHHVASIRADEPLERRRRKLADRVRSHLPPADAKRVTAFVGELVGIPFADDGGVPLYAARQNATLMGDQIRRAFEDLIAAECAHRPTLLVVDDLHWGDLPSVQLLDRALRRCQELPFMVLAVARPEVHAAFPKLWGARGVQEIRIGSLHRRHCDKLVRAALGDQVGDDTVVRIVERAAGNPFFLEELVRAHAEGRVDELPETVLAMLQARLESLEPEVRLVLRAASVFGRTFWQPGVSALLGKSTEAKRLGRWLDILCDRELIERRSGGRFSAHGEQYSFRHALLCDAAYAMLTDSDRALAHRLAGSWLEQAGEDNAAVLATHFERGGETARALSCLLRAAEQALEGHDFEQVLARTERAQSCGAEGEVLGVLRLLQAEAHRWLGEFLDGCQCAAQANTLLTPGISAWFRTIDEWITSTGRLGDYHDVSRWADMAAKEEPDAEAGSARVRALCSAARVLFHAGNYERADELLGTSLLAIQKQDARIDARTEAEVHRLRGAHARHAGDVVGDLAGYTAALNAYERAGDDRNASNARVSVAFAHIETGDYQRAEGVLERALADAERMGIATIATRARQNLGMVLCVRGDLDAARAMTQQAIEESREQQNVRFEAWTRIYLARIEFQAGNLQAAEREARLAADMLTVTPPARAGALAALARVLLAAGRAEAALSPAREAMEILRRFGGIEEFEPLVYVALVEALEANGDNQQARVILVEGRDRIHGHGAQFDEAQRDAFLRNVPDNARIGELAERLLDDTARKGEEP